MKTPFPIMSRSQAPGAGTSPYLLGRTQCNTHHHPLFFSTEGLSEMFLLCPITDPTEYLKQIAFSKFKGGQKKKANYFTGRRKNNSGLHTLGILFPLCPKETSHVRTKVGWMVKDFRVFQSRPWYTVARSYRHCMLSHFSRVRLCATP